MRRYNIVWSNAKTGKQGFLTSSSLTHKEACTMLKKQSTPRRPEIKIALEEAVPVNLEEIPFEAIERCRNLTRNTRDPERWSALEWLKLYACYAACEWDLTPDEWSADQVEAALKYGTVPTWGVYGRKATEDEMKLVEEHA